MLKYDITLPQAQVIMYVLEHEKATVTTLSQNLGISQSTISGVVDRLITKKILIKMTCAHDRRLQFLRVMPAVRNYYDNNKNQLLDRPLEKIVSNIKTDNLDIIKNGLTMLLNSLNEANHID
ncbi:hypothetical protein GCM10025879_02200 [Leuconostoc litchii]|uniref:MarR family transcriptional regulator n=1 Tax=Leuconostoc litchii TaxID=1981069 RepID=A0A6P2CMD3_9LACO|nr:helix-turn-helix domain-containing protein [Leuconostoc litchii]TYC47046.1 MarR family transcriptional regulator [Leuconostoc litchii]GMA68974.1 hypothetical protein GCM10025879_02200 [Leuconostoc litchii]